MRAQAIDHDRRRFLTRALMTISAAHIGFLDAAEAEGAPRELAALGGASEWLNSPRLKPESLVGRVVVVDFWTYTCINWLRTLPYVRAWAQKYGQHLVVIGAHTPEFAFEHDLENVRRAVQQMGIQYPIAIDNDYAIWRAFDNHYWPALYLLDPRGRVRHHQFGEGEYDQSEKAIQQLLAEAGSATDNRIVRVDGIGIEASADWNNLKSPENYLGSARTENYSTSASRLSLNHWTLTGDWARGSQAIVSKAPHAQNVYRFHARDLHVVMGPARQGMSVRFRVSIDGQTPGPAHGLDVDEGGNGTVSEQRLYQLIRQPKPIVDRTIAIAFLDAGVEALSFTFG